MTMIRMTSLMKKSEKILALKLISMGMEFQENNFF